MIKQRSFSPLAYILFCKLTPLDIRLVNTIVFCREINYVFTHSAFNLCMRIWIFRFCYDKIYIYILWRFFCLSVYICQGALQFDDDNLGQATNREVEEDRVTHSTLNPALKRFSKFINFWREIYLFMSGCTSIWRRQSQAALRESEEGRVSHSTFCSPRLSKFTPGHDRSQPRSTTYSEYFDINIKIFLFCIYVTCIPVYRILILPLQIVSDLITKVIFLTLVR